MSMTNVNLGTTLTTKDIGGMAEAAKHLGLEEYDYQNNRITPMILVPMRMPCQFLVSIPEGFYAVIVSYGSYVGLWNAGRHIMKPWESVSHLVTKQYVIFDSPVKECPTSDNVMVEIDVSVILNVRESEEDVRKFVFDLTPKGLEDMLKAFQEEAIRGMARQKKYSDIYDLMDIKEKFDDGDEDDNKATDDLQDQLANAKRTINAKLNEYGINIYSITITNVHLPSEFRSQMEEATTFDSKNLEETAAQKYNLLVIRNKEQREKQEQIIRDKLSEIKSKNQQQMATENRVIEEYMADTNKMIGKIDEESQGAKLMVESQSSLIVSRLEKEKELVWKTSKAEAGADVEKIRVETVAWSREEAVKADLSYQTNSAKILNLGAETEGMAAEKLMTKREFEAKMAHLMVLQKLAENKKLVLSGNNGDNIVAQLVTAQKSAFTLGLK